MTTTMNGHARDEAPTAPVMVPFAIPPRAGPAADWPPSRPEPETIARTEAVPRRAVDGDKLRRAAMWILASGVAAIAAAVSYSHIYDLGRVHGGTGVPARLLPLSVDMLIVAGELMLLHEADAKGRRFALGWVLVWSGILATLAANVTFGAQFGIVGALIWGWPAYSFILAAGGMVSIVKRGASREDDGRGDGDEAVIETPPAASEHTPQERPGTVTPPVISPVTVATTEPSPRPSRQPSKRTSGRDRASAIIKKDGTLTDAEVAKRAKVSESTARRARAGVPSSG
jgi:hypothetical protein